MDGADNLFPSDYIYTSGSEALPQQGTSTTGSQWIDFLNTTVKNLTVLVTGNKSAGNPNVTYNPQTGAYGTSNSNDLFALLVLAAIAYAILK